MTEMEIIEIMNLGKCVAALTMLLTIFLFVIWLVQGSEETGYRGEDNAH
jgi:flagellar biogenesis protein FliO